MNTYQKHLILASLALIIALPLMGFGQVVLAQGDDAISTVQVYDRIEWTVFVETLVENPYDPAQLDVFAHIVSPDGYAVDVTAFWMQPMAQVCEEDCAIEVLEPEGDPEWRVRFTPDQVGEWSVSFYQRIDEILTQLDEATFVVEPPSAGDSLPDGFVRISPNNRYFMFDSGTAYFPLGHNIAWSHDGAGGIFAYERWLESLAAQGGNYARLFVDVPWFIGFEWDGPVGDYAGSQDDFWRLDIIIESAEDLGIYLDVVILWQQALANDPGIPVVAPVQPVRADTSYDWNNNTYNVVNGGMLTSTTQFFTEDAARTLFKRRLRYLVARWGYSPNILAWDLLSEADLVVGYSPEIVLPWLDDMAAYLRDIDPNQHLITIGSAENTPQLIAASAIDFGQVRFYQRLPLVDPVDQVVNTASVIYDGLRLAGHPIMLTEFSLNPWYEPTENDPDGLHIVSTMWASIMAGAAGGASSWWWDTYIEPQALGQQVYPPLVQFTSNDLWTTAEFRPILSRITSGQMSDYRSLRVDDFDRRFLAEDERLAERFVVSPDGVFPGVSSLSAYLYGTNLNSQRHDVHTYDIEQPVGSQFTVGIASVSVDTSAQLVVRLDGEPIADLVLSANTTNAAFTVPIPAGSHELVFENIGDDWLALDYWEIAQYVAPVRAVTLGDTDIGILMAWFQNRAFSWQTPDATPVPDGTIAIYENMPPGQYAIEFWNPYSGQVVGEDIGLVEEDAILRIMLPAIDRALVVRASLISGMPAVTMQPTAVRATATPSPTYTPTHTATPTETPIPPTATPSLVPTPIILPSETPTETTEPSPLPLATNTPRFTATLSATVPPTDTLQPSATLTPSLTPTLRLTPHVYPD